MNSPVIKFVNHSKHVLNIAINLGWLPGARYTNLRDIRQFNNLGFLDIDWKNYCFSSHLEATKECQPLITVAHDIQKAKDLPKVLDQAYQLQEFSKYVVIVPKCKSLIKKFDDIPSNFILGFSVPSKYGSTNIHPKHFEGRKVHLLGGRPDTQRKLADQMTVVSLDCNRFTLDARYGDYFDGEIFRPHKVGGYERCIKDSIKNINSIWKSYVTDKSLSLRHELHYA